MNIRGASRLEHPRILSWVVEKQSLDLLNQSLEDLTDRLGTLLGNALLIMLVVNKRHTEAGLIALSPFEVATKTWISIVSGLLWGKATYSIRLQAM